MNTNSKTLKLFGHILAAIALLAGVMLPALSLCGTANLPTAQVLVSTGSAPVNGTNEVQTITFDDNITGGTFTLDFGGYATDFITWTATDATLVADIQANLN